MHAIAAQRFLEAFAAAAHDVELERDGVRIYHFFDSDFLGRVIFGYRDPLNHSLIAPGRSLDSENTDQRLLMAALLGQGIGAPPLMRALPPHLYEVRRAVSRPWLGDDAQTLSATIDALGLEHLLEDLLSSLENDDADDVLRRFLRLGPKIFSGIELLSGRWESRLGRVLRLGISESSPFDDDAEAMSANAFDVLARYIGQVTDGARQGHVSGLRDAMALSALAAGVRRSVGDVAPSEVARFYTETPRILNAWRARPEIRALLTYEVHNRTMVELNDVVGGVLRTPEYYLIRALMPDLGHRHEGSAPPSAEGTRRVYDIGRDLVAAAAELRRGGLTPELSGVRIGSSTLGQYMAEVTDLSSYSAAPSYTAAWRTLMSRLPPELPRDLVRQLKDELESGERRDALDASSASSSTRCRRALATYPSSLRHTCICSSGSPLEWWASTTVWQLRRARRAPPVGLHVGRCGRACTSPPRRLLRRLAVGYPHGARW